MLRETLREISERVEGVEAVLLISQDGLVVESVETRSDLDYEMLTAELAALVRAIADNHRELDNGPIQSFRVETDRYQLILSRVNDDFSLLLVTGANSTRGRARFELRRAPLALAAELEG
jgi:predicted regulator of Ras-like GTPase activity (Roadblock/LC7/MglB family)